MKGKIDSGQLCTVVPINAEEVEVGDIVLCKVNCNPKSMAANTSIS
jgi:hypothetical protein